MFICLFYFCLPLLLYSASFPCGPSFIPCETKAFGLRTDVDSGEDPDVALDPLKIASIQKEMEQLVSLADIKIAIEQAKEEVDSLFNHTERLMRRNIAARSFSSSDLSWSNLMKADQYAKYLSYSALISSTATAKIASSISVENIRNLPLISVNDTLLKEICPVSKIGKCVISKYRTFAGHCNNIRFPEQGSVYQPFRRLLSPDYGDKVSSPRRSISSDALPSSHLLSRLFSPSIEQHTVYSIMVAQWASFIYDDMVHIASNQLLKDDFYPGSDSLPIPCCDHNIDHPECYPIQDDEDVSSCTEYTRSMPSPRRNCTLGVREQANMVTGYLDGSQIYGSSKESAVKMRSFIDGKLNLRHPSVSLPNFTLPSSAKKEDCIAKQGKECLLAGSHRINTLPSNAVLYTIWMRQHNRLADQLKSLNPQWNDERIYEESRRIVVAQMQQITFNEYLFALLGKEQMKHPLKLRNSGFDSGYDLHLDGSVSNVFAAAIGQFYLSFLPSEFNDGQKSSFSIEKNMNNPSMIFDKENFNSVLRSLFTSPIMDSGLNMAPYLKKAFKSGSSKGIDMAAMLIHMGRDHGLPSYLQWRKRCQLPNANTFQEIAALMHPAVSANVLESAYRSPEDIDLIIGGLAELPLRGSLLGPTFACLYAEQMEHTKRGDRFWYENFFSPSAFTKSQLAEIRKTTLARIICDNADNVGEVQHNVFVLPDKFNNCPMSCSSETIDKLDLKYWIDEEPERTLPITKATLEKAIRLAVAQLTQLEEDEGRRISAFPVSTSPSALFSHASLMAPKKESLRIARTAALLSQVTHILTSGVGLEESERLPTSLDKQTLQRLLPQVHIDTIIGNVSAFLGRDPLPQSQCLPQPLPCDHTTKYRTLSGWCNNLKFPHYGNAFGPMRRLLDPVYDDGFDTPRITSSVTGRWLPSARDVSNKVHGNASSPSNPQFSHMLMQFGQILDHDMMHSPVARGPNNSILNCSSCDSAAILSINCFPIRIEKDDPFFPQKHSDGKPRCIPFTRSLLGQIKLGYRNQLNQLTSFLDLSTLYGSTECEANELRLFSFGKLNYTELNGKEALPQGNQERDCRSVLQNPKHKCFKAGDERNNEHPGLTVIHTILLREHNRIAQKLHDMNKFWTDEQLYQEARRINAARIQHVIYSEWLPIVLGCESMAKYNLKPKKNGYYNGYDSRCDASISHEMSTSAFRFGHSLIRKDFPRMDGSMRDTTIPVLLKDNFSNPSSLYNQTAGQLDSILMGLLGTESMAHDRLITDSVRNHLFAKPGGPLTGIDLPAVNIQRGRDHGVPPYNKYREFCGLGRAATFEDLLSNMEEETVSALRRTYEHVDDIDLFPGIMSEKPLKGALVGPTLACIIGEQMDRLKRCDRFYYESGDAAVRFTPDQLAEIRKTTFSKIICDNSDMAQEIQPNAFILPDKYRNSPMPCSQLPDTDLSRWIDRKYCTVNERVINLGYSIRVTPCVSCTCTTEGTECHSMVFDSCTALYEQFSAEEIEKDAVCVIQCSQFIQSKK